MYSRFEPTRNPIDTHHYKNQKLPANISNISSAHPSPKIKRLGFIQVKHNRNILRKSNC